MFPHSFGKHTAGHLEAVVEALVAGEVVERAHGARLGIGGAVDEPGDARLMHETGAHRTRLQRDVDRAVGETPAPELAAASRIAMNSA
jgi:hypothetical protein